MDAGVKHELSHAFAGVVLVGLSTFLDRVPLVWKALAVIAAAFVAGGVAQAYVAENLELPQRVSTLESQVLRLEAQDDSATQERSDLNDRIETAILLQLRTLCRLDGQTPSSCDLVYGGGQRIERPE